MKKTAAAVALLAALLATASACTEASDGQSATSEEAVTSAAVTSPEEDTAESDFFAETEESPSENSPESTDSAAEPDTAESATRPVTEETAPPQETESATEEDETVNAIRITQGTGEVFPYGDAVKAYLEAPHGSNVADYIVKMNNQAKPIVLGWEITGKVTELTLCYGLADAPVEEQTTVSLSATATSCKLVNLLKSREYVWMLTAVLDSGETHTATATFRTTDLGPRALTVEGVYNTRDAGGHVTVDGRETKQGMIIRGGELPETLRPQAQIFLSQTVGVKLEIDLRGYGSESGYREKSPIEGAELTYAVTDGYMGAFNPNLTGHFRHAFSCMAYEENYPIYVHCTGGADRTGTVIFLLNALLGVPEEQLIKDFEFTSFSYYGERSIDPNTFIGDLFQQFWAKLNSLEGETLADKTETYMLSIGVTQEEINNIRAIMLGDATTVSVDAPERYDFNESTDYQVTLRNVKGLTVTKVIIGDKEPAFTYENGCLTVSKEAMKDIPKGKTTVKLLLSDGRELTLDLAVTALVTTEIPLSAVECVNKTVRTDEIRIKVRSHGTVLQIGAQDLSDFSYLEIRYSSAGIAMFEDVGTYIALTNTAEPINQPGEVHSHILAQETLSNANGVDWEDDIRIVRLDLSDLTYEGMLYLAICMGDSNGVNVNSITFVTE